MWPRNFLLSKLFICNNYKKTLLGYRCISQGSPENRKREREGERERERERERGRERALF